MRFNWRRHLMMTAFATATMLPFVGCSGQQQGAEEEVAAEGQQGEEGEEQGGQETAQEGAEQPAEGQEAPATEETAANPATEGNNSSDAVVTNTPAEGSGNGDLNEIVSELQGNPAAGQVATTEQAAVPADGSQVPTNTAAVPADGTQAAPPAATPAEGQGAPAVAAAPGLPELGSKMPYVIEAGDTLAKLAVKIYGDQKRWRDIANLSGMANPNHIYPGDLVYYSLDETSKNFAATYEGVRRGKETVQEGDTLFAIAKRVYGSSKMWKHIWRQNDNIDNPDQLTAGMSIYYIEKGAVQSALNKLKNVEKTAAKKIETKTPNHMTKTTKNVTFASSM